MKFIEKTGLDKSILEYLERIQRRFIREQSPGKFIPKRLRQPVQNHQIFSMSKKQHVATVADTIFNLSTIGVHRKSISRPM